MNIQSFESGIENLKYQHLIAFTSTFYKDDAEGKVRSAACFRMLDNAQRLGIKVVVGDGSSGSEFLEILRSYPNVTVVHSGKGGDNADLSMAGERRFVSRQVKILFPDIRYKLWLEPEKEGLMTEKNIDKLLEPLIQGANVVIPNRTSASLGTMPRKQTKTEQFANQKLTDRLIQLNPHWNKGTVDFFVGPRMGDDAFWEEFENNDGKLWDGLMKPVMQGVKNGLVLDIVSIDIKYPVEQKIQESMGLLAKGFQTKRIFQVVYILSILDGIPHEYATVLAYIRSKDRSGLIKYLSSFTLSPGHEDSRRNIEEHNGSHFSIQKFTVKIDHCELGNHFHKNGINNLTEVFIIESGSGVVLLQDINEKMEKIGETLKIELGQGSIVTIPPYQAHTFILSEGTVMRGFRPQPYNEADKDLNAFKLSV